MSVTIHSKAAANQIGFRNLSQAGGLGILPRSILLVGVADASTDLALERRAVYSADEVGSLAGRGSPIHRLAIAAERGSRGQVPMAILPLDASATGVKAVWSAVFSGAPTAAGEIALYIAGDTTLRAAIQVTTSTTLDDIKADLAAKINALDDAPVTAAAAAGAGTITITAKSADEMTGKYTIEAAYLPNEELPAGITATITQTTAGSGTANLTTALAAVGDNPEWDTELVHHFSATTDLDKFSTWNGSGGDFTGLYNRAIARPLRTLGGDTTSSESDVITHANTRKSDRTSGIISAPGSPAHPAEIAAQVVGIMARINAVRAEGYYLGEPLQDILIGKANERYWETGDNDGGYTRRDGAVREGVSPTLYESGALRLQNVVTYYHPDGVPEANNGWADMSDISIVQNLLADLKSRFAADRWTGVTFYADKSEVSSSAARTKARDKTDVLAELIAAAQAYVGYGWLYEADYTIDKLAAGGLVTERDNGSGFDYTFPVRLRGKGYIRSGTGQFVVGGQVS